MLTFGKEKQTHKKLNKKEKANEQLAVSANLENNAPTNEQLATSHNTNFQSKTKKTNKLEINTSSKNCSDSTLTKSSSNNSPDSSLINDSTNTVLKAQTFSIRNIIYIIISIMLIVATIIGGVFSYIGSKEPEAIKNADITSANRVGGGADFFLDTSTINKDVYDDLLARMGGALGTVTIDLQSKGLILTMNGLDYQVVFRSKDYITLWLADCYKNADGSQYTSYYRSSYSGYTTNYETLESTNSIRERLTNTVFPGLFGSYQTLANSIIATPHDLSAAGVKWQTEQGETDWWSSYITTNSKLGSGAAGTAAYDKLWLPSGPELFKDASSSSSGAFVNPGLWGLTQTELMFDTASSYCWLRSGYSYRSYFACQLFSGGTQDYDYVSYDRGVRPALHMALPRVAEVAGYGLTFEGEGFTVTPSTSTAILPNTSKTITLNSDGLLALNGVTDQWGTVLTINGSGKTDNYSYTTKLDSTSQILTLILNNVTNHITFTVGTAPFIIINNNPTLITDVAASHTAISALTATVSAEYKNAAVPRVSAAGGVIEMVDVRGKGKCGSVNYSFIFVNSIMTLTLTNLPSGIQTITLDIISAGNYTVTVSASNATIAELYDNKGNAKINITPNAGYWVNSIVIDGKTYYIEYKSYEIADVPNAFKITYSASEIDNKFKLRFEDLKNNIALTINCSTVPLTDLKESGGAQITGVAVTTTLGGDAKILANDLGTDALNPTVTFVAWVQAGYKFAGWSIDNGATYLKNSSGEIYGASAAIPAELVKGKVVTACFTPLTNNNINTDLGTDSIL